MTEAELDRGIRDLLKLYRLYGYHTRDSRGSEPGFPDWCVISARGVLWRELKTQHGDLSPAQRRVRNLLVASGQNWSIWRPADLASGRIAAELASIAR